MEVENGLLVEDNTCSMVILGVLTSLYNGLNDL